ncbi:murein hydrolase activator NlpD [Pasteurella skyensis]|uniref:Murein hydrolase activator NlpD n=1 Tax=Phocoenobacter skyensis TaxID=97481 RepID=A0AAJ6N838_9PAST|nr:murein hydrolase activator NlpD [Pasteurella skyensis]MDP8161796.1 murein hydrolase activator NlpD [Pasteurella skyensis]MDP8171952.1 murein hydrolase activator NlpD [Pasteurella skyensis]MDP8176187.1 murein hydrolase activator NlpD [Pasteurella skyensis]MDP8178207.1 murein hydrolase activator NlpD [Pasteurella skyensis]MDP8182185.1 murein hydrolase activator NlpD [Pasteurella skyensis]
MKKTFLLLPLGAVVLASCSSQRAAPVGYASNADLVSGTTRSVNRAGNAGYQHNANIQKTRMPASMNTAPRAGASSVVPAVQPKGNSVVNTNVVPTVTQQQVVTNVTPKTMEKPTVAEGAINIPRDDATHKPIYSKIDKGFYDKNVYTVRQGDTMFLIAYIAGKDVREIAALNGLEEPYPLKIGQKIKLTNSYPSNVVKQRVVTQKVVTKAVVTKPEQAAIKAKGEIVDKAVSKVSYKETKNGTAYGSDGTVRGPVKATTSTERMTTKSVRVADSSLKWNWPTAGRVVSRFSSADGGNKGIDIKGTKGQAVKATASGRVVYAGNALQGYGNLIIIKHNDNYLSAYAHNDEMLVGEQDSVKIGQRIATMGNTGTNTTKLHFEIRYKGKSVNPMDYLPRR